MKSHMGLLREVLNELGTRCGTSTSRDLKTITARVEHEGFSFLTITLPSFAKGFERGLERGKVDSSDYLGFEMSGRLPAFLKGFVSLVFDAETGLLLSEPSIDCIYAVRQVCLLHQNVNLPCSDARINAALLGYVETDQEVNRLAEIRTLERREEFRTASSVLFGELLNDLDREICFSELLPKHGPGTTEDGTRGNAKYRHLQWTDRLESLFSFGEFLFPNWRYASADGVSFLAPGAEPPVRVITVPKTLKTPRIIAIEPVYMQYVQQSILEPLVAGLEGSSLLSGMIGFSDQEPNRQMAREGSITGHLATLDLSEASDRVSNQHVEDLFYYNSWVSQAVQVCRSTHADVPGHGVIPLSKFASMGSALCFPVEAMVFTTCVFIGLAKATGKPLTRALVKEFSGQVRVYGDDIIVPVEYVQFAVESLELYGFKVNSHKSFWTGKFRESCGGDYYDGTDVSVVRCRSLFPTKRTHVSEIVSLVSLRNQLFEAGYGKVCDYLDHVVEGFIPFPRILPNSPGLGKHSHDYDVDMMCPDTQQPLVRAAVVDARLPSDPLEGHGALLKWFLKRSDEPFADVDHLERAGRPERVTLKLRKVTPY